MTMKGEEKNTNIGRSRSKFSDYNKFSNIQVCRPALRFTYLLTPRCRVLLEQLTGLQLVKKFPGFHGTRKFISALTRVRHLSLSWTSPIQSTYQHATSWGSVRFTHVISATILHLLLTCSWFSSELFLRK